MSIIAHTPYRSLWRTALVAGIVIAILAMAAPMVSAHEDTGVRLLIPSVGVDAPIVRLGIREFANGDVTWDTSTITSEVGFLDGMTWFGQPGNTVLGGHSELEGRVPAVFYDLDKVAVGDEVVVTHADGALRYVVTRAFEVNRRDLSILYPTNHEQLTIITCDTDSFTGSGYARRTVVIAERVG